MKVRKIGVVAEDETDFDAIAILIRRIANKDNISFDKYCTNGGGKLINKLDNYAELLFVKKCNVLIVVHDLDQKNYISLEKQIQSKLTGNKILQTFVCIPVQELESWFLSDMKAVKSVWNLKGIPKVVHSPEEIDDPKSFLRELVRKNSDKYKITISTTFNKKLAEKLSLVEAHKKCVSFRKFHDFVSALSY